MEGLAEEIQSLLDKIQQNLFDKALAFKNDNMLEANDFEEFKEIIEHRGGFVLASLGWYIRN